MPAKQSLTSVITRSVAARGDKGMRECAVLFDSGATDSFISRAVAESLGTILPLADPNIYFIADGSPLRVTEGVTLTLYLNGHTVRDEFKINPAGSDELILGATTMSKYGMSVDFKHNDIIFSLSSAAPAGARQPKGVDMNEMLKRILARLGMSEIADSLTDEDAISMICEKVNRGYKAVAAPAILSALSLKEDATEIDARTAIAALKTLKTLKAPAESLSVPTPSVTFAGVFQKLGLTAGADLTEPQAIDMIAAHVKKPAPATAVAAKGVLKALNLDDTATEEEVIGVILAIQNPGNVITVEKHHEIEQQHREFRLHSVITGAIQAGKALPYEKDDLRREVEEWDKAGKDGLAIIEAKIKRRPKLMPIGERLPVKTITDTDLDADTMAIARQMGVSPETMKKYAQ